MMVAPLTVDGLRVVDVKVVVVVDATD